MYHFYVKCLYLAYLINIYNKQVDILVLDGNLEENLEKKIFILFRLQQWLKSLEKEVWNLIPNLFAYFGGFFFFCHCGNMQQVGTS